MKFLYYKTANCIVAMRCGAVRLYHFAGGFGVVRVQFGEHP